MSNRELVIAVFADAKQAEAVFAEGLPGAVKKFQYSVDEMAKKNVAAMTVQQTKLRELRASYLENAATMKAGTAEAIANNTLLENSNRKLGISAMSTGKLMDGMSRKAVLLGRSMSMYITVPIVAAAAMATKMFINFQRQMEMIHTQAGAKQAEVERQSKNILNFAGSGKSAMSPVDLSQGLYHLESIGLRGAKAFDALKVSSDAAGLGIANLEDVTTAFGGAVVTGIKGTENFNTAMGTINATIGAGNMRMGDFAAALSTAVLPAAKDLGLTLPEVGAALAVLTDRGMGAQMAATRLRMSFSMMANPTQSATKALGELGIKQFQIANLMRSGPDGLVKALELVQAGMDRMKDKSKATALVLDAFGKGRSGAGILTLLNSLSSSVSSVQGKLAQIEAGQKKFAEDVARYHQTAQYKITSAWHAIQASMIKAGGAIAPYVVIIARTIEGLVQTFSDLPPGIKQATGLALVLFATLGPLLLIVGKIGRAFIEAGALAKGFATLLGLTSAGEVADVAAVTTAVEAENVALGPEQVAAARLGAAGVATSMGEEVVAAEGATTAVLGVRAALLGIAALGAVAATIVITRIWKGAPGFGQFPDPTAKGFPQNLGKGKFLGPSDSQARATGMIAYDVGGGKAVNFNTATGKFTSVDADGKSIALSIGSAAALLEITIKQVKAFAAKYYKPIPDTVDPGRGGGGVNTGHVTAIGNVKADWINSASAKAGISASALKAIISQETGGHWEINSDSGATGYGQIMPSTGAGMPYNYKDPKGNVFDSAILLAGAVKKYGSYAKAFASYYGGGYGARVYGTSAGDVRQGGGKYPSVNEYVQSVMSKMSTMPVNAFNNPMADQLHPSTHPEADAAKKKALAAAKKAAAAAKKAADEAAKGIIDPIRQTIDQVHTAVKAAIKAGATPKKIEATMRHEIQSYSASLEKLEKERKGASKEEKSKLDPVIARLKNGLKMARAALKNELNAQAAAVDKAKNVVAKGLVSTFELQYSEFTKKFSGLTSLQGFVIPGFTTNITSEITKALNAESKTLKSEIAGLRTKLQKATAKTKATYQKELDNLLQDQIDVNNAIEDNMKQKVSDLQTVYDNALSKFEGSFGLIVGEIVAQFEQQTQDYITNALGSQFFQNGLLTPSEQALKDLQASMNNDQLVNTVNDARQNLISDLSSGADQVKIKQDVAQVKADEDAFRAQELETRATQERADADQAYAHAVQTYTNERTVEERQLTDSLTKLQTSIENGTGSLDDINVILGQYGITLDGVNAQLYGIDFPLTRAALTGPGGLVDATHNLQDAFNALINWVNEHTGTNITATSTPSSDLYPNFTDIVANAYAAALAQPYGVGSGAGGAAGYFLLNPIRMASGGVVRSPTYAMVGESGPEAVIPLSQLNSGGTGDVHIHFDGTVFGTSPDKIARELEPHIRAAIVRVQRSNVTSGIR